MSEVQLEKLLIDPPAEFAAQANAKADLYEKAKADRLGFWASEAENLDWFKKWDKILDDSNPPFFKWFVGGKINACYNCVDRHVKTWRRNKAAILFEGEPGDSQVLTYDQLYVEVQKFANVLKSLGVQKGDRVTIYLPMIPEAVIAMLACARIGAPHSVVFGGFSSDALRDRINDAKAKIVITADGGWRRGNVVPLKANTDKALEDAPTVEKVIVVKRVGDAAQINWVEGRDLWYHELMAKADRNCEPEQCDAEDMLFILYSSGTTGKPKGILHTTGGYLTQANMTMRYVFDIKDTDVYWCTADIGWITGHTYIVYGPLSAGATVVLYEGGPDYPDKDRFWAIIEKYRVNIFYTAPTAIRTFMKWGLEYVQRHDLSTLRLLGTVGEPINPEAWMWYYKHIGGERCPIVDTWWQTETGAHMGAPLPGVTKLRPGTFTLPIPGIEIDVVDDNKQPTDRGYLVVRSPWPSMLRTLWGDDNRYIETYWKKFGDLYFTGDGAIRDEQGYIWVTGRVDDVLNVSGHRIGTAEVESALVECQEVAEAAVIGKKHEVKGEAIVAFVILKEGVQPSDELVNKLKKHVAAKLGAFCRPDDIIFTAELPKTRSGKIMRRLLRDIAEGRVIGDTTTLADPGVMAQIKEKYASKDED